MAGTFGAAGIAAAAASAHGGDQRQMGAVALVALTHAVLLACIGLSANRSRFGAFAAATITVGLILFCGDLAIRSFTGDAILPLVAPAGGIFLMLGWIVLGLGGATGRLE